MNRYDMALTFVQCTCMYSFCTLSICLASGMDAFVLLRRLTNGIIGMEYTYRMYKYTKCKEIYVKVFTLFHSELRHLKTGSDNMSSLFSGCVSADCTFIPTYFIDTALSILCEN
jgi:hypothetical protein